MIKLFWCPQIRASRILWMLEEMGEPFEVETVDVMVGSSIYFMKTFGILPENSVLKAYLGRCLARPAYAKALAKDAEFPA